MHSQNKLSLTIESAQLDEASEISKMIIKNVNYFHVNSYTKEEIKIWERGYSISEMKKQILNKEVYVMRNNDMIYGTIQFDCPEIKGFYVNPEFKSMGFGSILLQFMLSNLRIRGYKQVIQIQLGFIENLVLSKLKKK